ncbi:hypothetical protein B4135_3548 [Caldibacillus debilis]|uniref:Uncharacterized protein n=1 Tax=Caldibacillus debilis TaxID=301148 RepID=A0A150LDE7_9BACI|nr:hypothetical protein B4135_3548 [Caldibacillus debilis]
MLDKNFQMMDIFLKMLDSPGRCWSFFFQMLDVPVEMLDRPFRNPE